MPVLIDHETRAVARYNVQKRLGRLTWLLWVMWGAAIIFALILAFCLGRLTA